jgi:hypothetical protein
MTSSTPTFCLKNVSLSNNTASTHQHQRQRQQQQRQQQRHYLWSSLAILQEATSAHSHNKGNISNNQRDSNTVPASPLNSSCKPHLQQGTPQPRPKVSDSLIFTANTPLQTGNFQHNQLTVTRVSSQGRQYGAHRQATRFT